MHLIPERPTWRGALFVLGLVVVGSAIEGTVKTVIEHHYSNRMAEQKYDTDDTSFPLRYH